MSGQGDAPAGKKINGGGAEGNPVNPDANHDQHSGPVLDCAMAPNASSRRWVQGEISWAQLIEKAQQPASRKECGLYVLGTLRDGQRTKETVTSRSALVLDADKATPALWAALADLGVLALAHTTFRSAPGALRLRIIVPLASPVQPEEYEHAVDVLMQQLGVAQFDRSSREPSRGMYWPAAADEMLYAWREYVGPLLDPADLLAVAVHVADPAPRAESASAASPDPASAERYVLHAVPQVLADLDDLALLAPQQRNAQGQGWEEASGIYHRAARLVELSNLAPRAYPLDQAAADYMAHAPHGYEQQCARKWDDAVHAVGTRPAPLPPRAAQPDVADPTAFEEQVAREVARLQVQAEARKRLAAHGAHELVLPPLARLDHFLDEPDPEVDYRIGGLWPAGGRVVFAAQQKAGKTTALANVLRALADGDMFLGQFPAERAARVVLLDNELDANMLRRWLRDQGIANPEHIELVTLRGRLSTFNILEEDTRARWAQHIGAADVLLFDCLRPALDALGLDENRDAGRFLEAFDELITAAGIPEALVVHHMGHGNERSRGDSRILDWPDAIWTLVRGQGDDGTAPRYFKAHGRDVQVPESQLAYDAIARRLSITGGSRGDQKINECTTALLALLAEAPGQSGRAIEDALSSEEFPRDKVVRKAIARAVSEELVIVKRGAKNANLHFLNPEAVET